MNSHPMFSLIYPLRLYTITLFIIFIILDFSYGDQYEDCSSRVSCGTVKNIGYPFWGAGRPRYCGHPALQIQCSSNHTGDFPTVNISLGELGNPQIGDWKIVHSILNIQEKPDEDTIIIKIKQLISHDTCLISCKEKGVDETSLFEYRSLVRNISLVYGKDCHDPKLVAGRKSITCQASGKNLTTSYYVQDTSYWVNKKNCTVLNISVPLGEELDDLVRADGTLVNVLQQDFEVDYSKHYSDLCFKCQVSGGVCGSSDFSGFICHCKDNDPGVFYQLCPTATRKHKQLKLILGLAIPGGILFLALNAAFCYCKKPKFHSPRSLSRLVSCDPVNSDLEIQCSIYGIPVFTYTELQEATNNFDQTRELGDGGFGIVYYGKLRDGREVAVKRLYERNYKRIGQFTNEIEILTKLRHKNLVTLYGCTSCHSRELLLVYEFIPNGTVADHLYGGKSVSRTLSWTIRMKIAIETASALSYLYASDIIHRDVKTNNILLDNNFSVKVADFGLSRLFPFDATHVSTAPQGTPGYLDPEYYKCYQVTSKSVVYSFGVVLIELISSLPAIDTSRNESEVNLSDYAMNRIQNAELDKLIDRKLWFESDFRVKRMTTLVAELAFRCLQQEKEVRPSMEEVLEALKQIENADYEAIEAEETTRSIFDNRLGNAQCWVASCLSS